MTLDEADETIASLQDEMEVAATMSDAISSPVSEAVADDRELEDELDDLLMEDREDLLNKLPHVPVTPPKAPAKFQDVPVSPEEASQLEKELDDLLNDPSLASNVGKKITAEAS